MNRSFAPVFAALLLFLVSASQGLGQLVVYKLTFDVAGETINYRPYQGGFYVAPIEGGTGTLILTLTTGGVKQFYSYANFGELFVAVKGENRKVVLSATAANTVSTTTFFAIGTANDKKEVETRSSDGIIFVAKELKGYAVSADSERDLPYASSSPTDIGVAGVSYLRALIDDGKTEDAIKNSRTLADQVTLITTDLTEDGYVNGQTTTAGAGNTTTPATTTGTTSNGATTTGTTTAAGGTGTGGATTTR
jgi:hypothetical protein